jgi:hypothetical protein
MKYFNKYMNKHDAGKALLSVLLSSLAASLPFCALEVGNPKQDKSSFYSQVDLSIQGTRPAGSSPALHRKGSGSRAAASVSMDVLASDGSTLGTLQLEQARIVLSEIKLESDESIAGLEQDEIQYEGPFVTDLLTNETVPSLESIRLPAGRYHEISMKLDKLEKEEINSIDEADPILERSIYIAGTYTGQLGGGFVSEAPFSLSFEFDEEFKLRKTGEQVESFVLEQGQTNPVIIAFRLNQWFRLQNPETNENNLDFRDLELVDGALHLTKDSSGSNREIFEIIKEDIKNSADYGKDENGNGELDTEEDDDPDQEDEFDD